MPLFQLKLDCDFLSGITDCFGLAALAVLDQDYAELAVLYHTIVCSFACAYRQAAALVVPAEIYR